MVMKMAVAWWFWAWINFSGAVVFGPFDSQEQCEKIRKMVIKEAVSSFSFTPDANVRQCVSDK